MSAVVFETPGLIDMRAFTMMGMSAKPATQSPIGYLFTRCQPQAFSHSKLSSGQAF
jgi:hypothetical protein